MTKDYAIFLHVGMLSLPDDTATMDDYLLRNPAVVKTLEELQSWSSELVLTTGTFGCLPITSTLTLRFRNYLTFYPVQGGPLRPMDFLKSPIGGFLNRVITK